MLWLLTKTIYTDVRLMFQATKFQNRKLFLETATKTIPYGMCRLNSLDFCLLDNAEISLFCYKTCDKKKIIRISDWFDTRERGLETIMINFVKRVETWVSCLWSCRHTFPILCFTHKWSRIQGGGVEVQPMCVSLKVVTC